MTTSVQRRTNWRRVIAVAALLIGAGLVALGQQPGCAAATPAPKSTPASSDCSAPPGSHATAPRRTHTYYGTATKTGYATGAQFRVGPIGGTILPFFRGKYEGNWADQLTAYEGDKVTVDVTGVGDATAQAKVTCALYRLVDPVNLKANAVPANLVGVPQSGTGPRGNAHCEITSGE